MLPIAQARRALLVHLPLTHNHCYCMQAKIPRRKTISGVRSNRTRWNNIHSQCAMNNLMKPILTPS